MYFGPRDGLMPWFSETLGYSYNPAMHGMVSDWVMDLVNIGFRKPQVGCLLSSRCSVINTSCSESAMVPATLPSPLEV
jgi:hypothetical protein